VSGLKALPWPSLAHAPHRIVPISILEPYRIAPLVAPSSGELAQSAAPAWRGPWRFASESPATMSVWV
jgi:hypothetical protein